MKAIRETAGVYRLETDHGVYTIENQDRAFHRAHGLEYFGDYWRVTDSDDEWVQDYVLKAQAIAEVGGEYSETVRGLTIHYKKQGQDRWTVTIGKTDSLDLAGDWLDIRDTIHRTIKNGK